MIQRIQSIFLLIVILCGASWGSMLFIALTNSNNDNTIDLSALVITWLILNLISVLLASITIFLYKNRAFQMRLCIGLVVTNIVLFIIPILLSSFYALFPLTAVISAYLARKYIKKDEELVRSADRIR